MRRRPHILACCAAPPIPHSRYRPARTRITHGRRISPEAAFALPAAAATAVAAAAALAAALRAILSERTRRAVSAAMVRTRRRVQHALHLNSTRVVASSSPPTYANRLDTVAERAASQLESDLVPDVVPNDPVLYAKLPAQLRADLLLEAFREVAARSKPAPVPAAAAAAVAAPISTTVASPTPASRENWESAMNFWKMAEGVNGRLAALGFAICLLRETLEPAHPSMLAQLKDVLVPVAVHTPPFLVAVVDSLVDWLT